MYYAIGPLLNSAEWIRISLHVHEWVECSKTSKNQYFDVRDGVVNAHSMPVLGLIWDVISRATLNRRGMGGIRCSWVAKMCRTIRRIASFCTIVLSVSPCWDYASNKCTASHYPQQRAFGKGRYLLLISPALRWQAQLGSAENASVENPFNTLRSYTICLAYKKVASFQNKRCQEFGDIDGSRRWGMTSQQFEFDICKIAVRFSFWQ